MELMRIGYWCNYALGESSYNLAIHSRIENYQRLVSESILYAVQRGIP